MRLNYEARWRLPFQRNFDGRIAKGATMVDIDIDRETLRS
jgi:hypothetical protein